VAVFAGKSIVYIELFFAVAGIGSVFTVINPIFTAEEMIYRMAFILRSSANSLLISYNSSMQVQGQFSSLPE